MSLITGVFENYRWTIDRFEPFERQEYSRTADGVTRGKSFGESLWRIAATSQPMFQADLLTLRAKLDQLDGVVNRFLFGDRRRRYPYNYSDGVFGDTGSILTVNADNIRLSLTGLDFGFQIKAGDYLAFQYAGGSYALHRAAEDAVAGTGGATPEFKVRPHIRPGIVSSPMPAVTLKNPMCLFALDPDSIKENKIDAQHWSLSFSGVQIIE
jgi:hypothetical protein